MPAYTGEWRLISQQPVSPELRALARKLVGGMLDMGGVPTRTWQLDDGTRISALIVNDIPKVTITQPPPAQTPAQTPATEWVPRGFVVYPAWHAQPFGVGLPIVQSGSDPYASVNLSPGLSTNRWTAGGPCGEVLVSADLQAAYPAPTFIPAPLLADATRGPQFLGDQTNYDQRQPDGAWTAYRLELAPFVAHYGDENVMVQQSLFATVNAARTAAGQVAATLRFRGYARPAEMATSIFVTAGTDAETSTSYPLAYQSSADRVTKEGYACNWLGAGATGFGRSDLFATQEFRAAGASPADAVAAWQAQPGSVLTANMGPCVWADVGYRGGYSVLALAARDRWIEAGNVTWQSADPQLPPISWMGFASVNLAWETYPATYDPANASTAPLVPMYAFTDSTGDCWLNYPRATQQQPATVDAAMGRHIYCRGRSIALAPNGGLVWGACVMSNGADDRMIVLIHHPVDQPTDYTHQGWTRYLRVWWADIPRRANGQRLAPQLTICGTDAADPWAWRGGQLVDVGAMPPPSTGGTLPPGACSALKYASQWRFARDGSKAICLRDYGLFADYASLLGAGVSSSTGKYPRAVELTFNSTTQGVSATVDFHDYVPGAWAQPKQRTGLLDTTAMAAYPWYEQGLVPLAVDYDATGAVVYGYLGRVTDYIQDVGAVYLGTGSAAAVYPSDLAHRVLTGANYQLDTLNFDPSGWNVCDVVSGAFVVDGVLPNEAFFYNPDGSFGTRPTGAPCFPFTETPVHGVTMYQRGAARRTDWYPAPDGAVFTLATACSSDPNAVFVELPLAVSRTVQPSLATRFGQQVFCYQVSPLPSAVWTLNAAPSGACGCRLDLVELQNASHVMQPAELNPRGGAAVSTVPLPANDWLIYAKVA